MERLILKRLLEWKNSPYRKPLILKGVRQVGKTWILKEFGRRYYDNTAYFNFDEHEEYKQFFETTKDVDRLLQNLMLASGQKITPEKTLIIFDEVQDCPKVINSMKYFCENAPQYHIACAGSLLGIALAKPSSFPVGKVNFMQIDPMTFTEFLLANGDENLAKYLDAVDTLEPLPDAFFNPLYEKLKMYYVTGGMPESVLMWTQARDVEAMQEALSGIIGAYERDFAKHPNVSEFPKISMIWKSVPSQLARENKKFIYKVVKEGARAREYEDALQWLVDAQLVHKVYRSTAPGLPMSAYDDLSAFKIYLVDGICVFFAVLPIICFITEKKLDYWLSLLAAEVYSFITIFVGNLGTISKLYPLVAAFTLSGYYESTPADILLSVISMALCGMISGILIYRLSKRDALQ